MRAFDRNELHAISRRAHHAASDAENPNWIRAFSDLAHAANVLDAHLARSTIHVCPKCDSRVDDNEIVDMAIAAEAAPE